MTIRIDWETGKRADLDTKKSLFEVFREDNAPAEPTVTTTTVSDDSTGGVVVSVPETEDDIVEDIF